MDEYTSQKIKDLLETQVLKKTGFTAGGCINEGEGYETDNGLVFIKKNNSPHVNVDLIQFYFAILQPFSKLSSNTSIVF